MKDSKQVRTEHRSFTDAYPEIHKASAPVVTESVVTPVVEKKEKVEMVLVRKDNAFTEQAEKYQMVVKQFARFVEANNHLFDIPTRKKAILANKFQGFKEDAEWDEFFGDQELIDENLLKKADTALGNYGKAAEKTVKKVVKSGANLVGKTAGHVVKGYNSVNKEAYVVHTADKKANTPAWQGYLEGKINELTGEPLYVAGEDLQQEGLGVGLAAGALATGLAVKGIQTANKIKNDAKSGKKGTTGGMIQNRTNKINSLLNNSSEVQGDDLQEITTKDTKSGTKFKVRVKDKASGSSYIRFATREKISQLRADPKIASVEMTDEGQTPEERGEKKAQAAGGGKKKDDHKDENPKAEAPKASKEKPEKRKRSVTTEARSNWRSDLKEVIGDEITENKGKKKKGVKNPVCVNPDSDDDKNKYEELDSKKVAESIGAELKGLEIEDADGKTAFEVVDLVKPEPMKGIATVEELRAPTSSAGSTAVKSLVKNTIKKKTTKDTRYNPFNDGRTPTSASQTTGP